MEEKIASSHIISRQNERGEIERPHISSRHQQVSKLNKLGILLLILVITVTTLSWHIPTIKILAKSFRHFLSTSHNSEIKGMDDWWCESDATALGRPRKTKGEYEKCTSIAASKTQLFDFNLTDDVDVSQVWRFIDKAPAKSRGRLRGEIVFDRGHPSQASDIHVRIVVASNREADLENVSVYKAYPGLAMSYNITNEDNVCTEVQAQVYLRPWPRRALDTLKVRTEVLNIVFRDNLDWEVNHLIGQNTYGDSDYNIDGETPLITHNVTVWSQSGEIVGTFAADGHVTAQNNDGPIGFFLKPLKGRPSRLQSLVVFNWLGSVHIWSCFQDWPVQPHDHWTSVYTWSGDIWAYIPHGRMTGIASQESSIRACIRPYGITDLSEMNKLSTGMDSGYTYVHVLETETKEGLYDPLNNMTSDHIQLHGSMKLFYPDTWSGTIEGNVKNGSTDSINLDSSSLEFVERGEGFLNAQKGTTGESRLSAKGMDRTFLNIKLGGEVSQSPTS